MKPSIDDLRTINSWASSYNWSLSFIQFPSGILSVDPKGLDIRCASAEQPICSIPDVRLGMKGFEIYMPGARQYNPLTLSFQESEDNFISNFIRDWKLLCFNPQTGVQQPKYLLEAIVRLARLSRLGNEIYEYILIGAWPMQSDPGGQLGDQAEILRPSLTLRYDYFLEQSLI
jgi:hypothetical protein